MNYFPNGDEEIALIKFIAKNQYLSIYDVKYFFGTKDYYRKRIISLVKKNYLKRTNLNLVLGELGVEYAKLSSFEYTKPNRNQKYIPRLSYMSNLGAYFFNCNTISFTPSFLIKDKEILTISARKFIGLLSINGVDYLTYHITSQHTNRYITSVIYDIQKEKAHKNILILLDNTAQIKISDFTFGLNQVLIIKDTENNRELLKYIYNMNWSKVIEHFYKSKVYLSEYNFCDYTNYKDKFVSTFYFLDTEKINKIKHFLRENNNKTMDIICDNSLKDEIKAEIPNANYITINLEDYIEKQRTYYE